MFWFLMGLSGSPQIFEVTFGFGYLLYFHCHMKSLLFVYQARFEYSCILQESAKSYRTKISMGIRVQLFGVRDKEVLDSFVDPKPKAEPKLQVKEEWHEWIICTY